MSPEIKYKCVNFDASNDEPQNWSAKIESLTIRPDGYEGTIIGRDTTIFFIVGISKHGRYVCLPDLGIGSPLADLSDTFWNSERLVMNKLSTADAITVATGLKIISEL